MTSPPSSTKSSYAASLKSSEEQEKDTSILLMEPEPQKTVRTGEVVAVVAFYIFSSITTILLNKSVLNSAGIPSLLFLWCQLVVAVIILQLAKLVGLLRLPSVSVEAFKQLSGLIGINVVGLALNTLCLANIDAVLYQVARSLILPMTVAMSPFVTGAYPSGRVLLACSFIFVGFIIGIFGERHISQASMAVSTTGIIFGVLSSLSTSCHSFIIKGSFGKVQSKYSAGGTFDLVYFNNLFSAIILLPILFLVEWKPIQEFIVICQEDGSRLQSFAVGTVLSGASGLLINLAGFLQIKITSPITHTVSSAARGVLQTIAARIFLGEAITVPRCIGISITLAGSCLYSWFKSKENAYRQVSK